MEFRNSGEDLELRFESSDWFSLLNPPDLSAAQESIIFNFIAKQWDQMPSFEKQIVQLPRIFSQPKSKSICFYPGSFNPWHEGHQACVDLTPVESLVIVPDANPWKQTTASITFKTIIKLMKTVPENTSLYPGFINLEVGNPTVSWLPTTKWQNKSLSIGADSFVNLEKWKDVKTLLNCLETLYVVPRNIVDQQMNQTTQIIQNLCPALKIEILAHHQFENVSSTDLRK